MNGGDARVGVFHHRALDVADAAVARVRIRDDGHVGHAHHVAGLGEHFGLRHQTDVGHAQRAGGCAEAGHVDGVEARMFDKARGRIVGSEQYLTKPFTREELLGAIRTYVNA